MAGILDRKVALVTGGASGIGRATALAMSREGALVAVADRTEESAAGTVALINATGGLGYLSACRRRERSPRFRESCDLAFPSQMYSATRFGLVYFFFRAFELFLPERYLVETFLRVFFRFVSENGSWFSPGS